MSSPRLVEGSTFTSSDESDHDDGKGSPPEPLDLSELSVSPAAVEGSVVGGVGKLKGVLVNVISLWRVELTNCRGMSILEVW